MLGTRISPACQRETDRKTCSFHPKRLLKFDVKNLDRIEHNVLVRMGEIKGLGQWDSEYDTRFIEYMIDRYGYWGYMRRLWRQRLSLRGRGGHSVWIE